MTQWAIVDSGPLVAFLDRREKCHAWVAEQVHHLATPILVCEPVLVETAFLLARSPAAQDSLLGLLENETLKIALIWATIFPKFVPCAKNTATHRCL